MPGILRVDQANVDYIYAKTSGGKTYIPGHVIQVVTYSYSTQYVRTSMTSSWVATPIAATITPTSTNSKILIQITTKSNGTSSHNMVCLGILRNGSLVGSKMQTCVADSYGYATFASLQYIDSPSTTSSTTYALGTADLNNDGGGIYINRGSNNGNTIEADSESNIVLMEIAQ